MIPERPGGIGIRILYLPLLCGLFTSLGGCGAAAEPSHGEVAGEEPEVELAVLMGEMQRHSAKLGHAIEGSNPPLADFYLHEVREVLEKLMTVETHEGMPIAEPAGVILGAALEALEARLSASEGDGAIDWSEAWRGYEATIEACNRCHRATEHDFIEILPAAGEPAFNQRFGARSEPVAGSAPG